MIDEITHANVLYRRDIEEFLDYVDGLKRDSEDEDYSDEERASFKELLDDHDQTQIEQLRAMVNDSYADDFINEGYWDTYAAELADDVYLQGVPEIIRDYFDYEKWASDLTADYTSYDFDGVTYYAHD